MLNKTRFCCEYAQAGGLWVWMEVYEDGPFTICEKCMSNDLGSNNIHAVEMGRKGGKIGGVVRASRLSPERRREIASQAAKARWGRR